MKHLIERLSNWSKTRAGAPALIHLAEADREEQRLDYRTLDLCTASVASQLRRAGLEPGDRVLVTARCEVRYLVGLLGCLRAGVIAVPTLAPTNERALARIQAHGEDAGAVALIADAWTLSRRARLSGPQAAWLQGLEWIDIEPAFAQEAAVLLEPGTLGKASDQPVAYLQYTSGSTSRPKGVRVTHGNLAAQLGALQEALGHVPGEVVCNWMPLHHDFGLILSLQALYAGGTAVLLPSVTAAQRPMRWLQAVSRYRAVTSAAPNFMFQRCVERIEPQERALLDLSSLRTMMNGAEPVHPDCVRAFDAAFSDCGFRPASWRVIYGLAEATLAVTLGAKGEGCRFARFQADSLRDLLVEPDSAGQELTSCGIPVLAESLAIVDPETHRRCEPGRVGEVWVAGPSVGDGYWGASDQTEQAAQGFGMQVDGEPGSTSFLRTGDLGLLWEGELYIAGRLKDLVIVRGENHYPQDIEATVCLSHPALEPNGAAAFAVDGANSEALAVVAEVRREGFRRLDPTGIFAAVRRGVAQEHGLDPAHIVLLKPGTLPRTSSGKVQRRGCRQEWMAGELSVVAQWDAPAEAPEGEGPGGEGAAESANFALHEFEGEVLALCRDLLAPERVELGTNLFEAGADSLKMADLTLVIQERWGVSLDLTDLAEHPTPATLAQLLGRCEVAATGPGPSRSDPEPARPSRPSRIPALVSRWFRRKDSSSPSEPEPGASPKAAVGSTAGAAEAASFFLGDSSASQDLSTEVLRARLLPYVKAWRGRRTQADSLVAGLHADGPRVPLFWVFQGHQEWAALGRALGPEQPLYGMRSGNLVMPYTETNVQALATAYRREIQTLWPNGPYLIGGNCQGGLIALAVAQQLWRLQQPVAMLALMEWGFGPQVYAGRVALLWGEDSEKNPFRKSMEPAALAKRLYRAHTIDLLPGAHGQFFDPQRVGHLARALRHRIDEALVDAPPFLPLQARRAALQILDAPALIEPGSTVRLEVEVRNVSAWRWEQAEVSGLWLGGKWMDDAGSVLEVCARLAPLPAMTPGAAERFRVDLTAPIRRGAVVFEARLLEDGVGWFEDCATQATRIRIGER